MKPIEVKTGIYFTEVRASDKPQYLEYFKDKEIYDNTSRIPYPYTEQHADEWIALNLEWEKKGLTHFAIRNDKGLIMGGGGFLDLEPGKSFKAEIGYWLAKKFWDQGIMTAVVARLCKMGFDEFGLKRISALTFSHNKASQKVLEKNEFEYEGTLRNFWIKDGKLIDARAYAKIS